VTGGDHDLVRDPIRPAAERALRLATAASWLSGPTATTDDLRAALVAAKQLTDSAARDLLAAVVVRARADMTDAEIGEALLVTGHAVSQRFPSNGKRRRGRRPRPADG
jgi:alkylhydroperoxidase family enzyme